MKFSEIIEGLQNGRVYARTKWNENCAGAEKTYIARQVPQSLSGGVVKDMTSLPVLARELITKHDAAVNPGCLAFYDQVLIIHSTWDGSFATGYTPTWEDIFAEDWQIEMPAED